MVFNSDSDLVLDASSLRDAFGLHWIGLGWIWFWVWILALEFQVYS